ncbi:MAG: hypothetical protein HRU10_00090 [Opitutales bacterium]|nr:hypothetical protein [Opitutales bacterium]
MSAKPSPHPFTCHWLKKSAAICVATSIAWAQDEAPTPVETQIPVAEEEIFIELPEQQEVEVIQDTPQTPEAEIEPTPEVPDVAPIEPEAAPEEQPISIDLEDIASPTPPPPGPAAEDIPDVAVPTSFEEEVILQLPQGGAPAPTFGTEETITVNYLDQDITTILRNVADLYDLNLVVPDTVTGRASLKLRNVTWRQVFEVVLETSGSTYIEDGNIIKIKSLEDLAVEPVDTRVFIINFAEANEIQSAVRPLISSQAGGGIRVDTRTNALIVTERPSRMNKIQEIIERLDRETEQVMIESKFVEVTNRDAENIGVNWLSLGGYQVGTGSFTRTFNRSNSTSRSNGTTESSNSNTGNNFSNSDTSSNTFGSNFSSGTAGSGFSDTIASSTGSSLANSLTTSGGTAVSDFVSFVNDSAIGRVDNVVFSADGFNVILSALENYSDVELVSNPTVVTLNNESALISIGERFPIPNYTYNEERGSYEVSNFNYEDIGIKLNVTPQVNSAGFINLDILPEVSSRQGTVSFGGASGAEIPIIASRRTETTISLKDGYTLAIGGLMENQTENGETKVPLLGDIPGLGRLFRSTTKSESKRNLIIFITAKTLSADGSTYRDVIDPRQLDDMNLVPSDIPGYQLSEDERRYFEQREALRAEIQSLRVTKSQLEEIERLRGSRGEAEENLQADDEEDEAAQNDDWWRRRGSKIN